MSDTKRRGLVERLRIREPLLGMMCDEAADRIEQLEAALHEAFMAMSNQRDNPDAEVFQDAIDALGMAAEPTPEQLIEDIKARHERETDT